jgi:hypothetical protein
MASFAKLNLENIVVTVESVVNEVITDNNGIEQEPIGIQFLKNLYNEPNANWKQTSYNTVGGVHTKGGIPFRKNHAGIGYTYDEDRDAFIPKKPFNSWILNESTCNWEAPILRPNLTEEQKSQGYSYYWSEASISWILRTPMPLTYNLNLTRKNGTPLHDPYTWNEETLNWNLLDNNS